MNPSPSRRNQRQWLNRPSRHISSCSSPQLRRTALRPLLSCGGPRLPRVSRFGDIKASHGIPVIPRSFPRPVENSKLAIAGEVFHLVAICCARQGAAHEAAPFFYLSLAPILAIPDLDGSHPPSGRIQMALPRWPRGVVQEVMLAPEAAPKARNLIIPNAFATLTFKEANCAARAWVQELDFQRGRASANAALRLNRIG
jgi:hypothetical protein